MSMIHNIEELEEAFSRLERENYLKFELIENKFNRRADLHAFILLDKLQPGDRDIITGAEHDKIYLSIDVQTLFDDHALSEDHVRDLIRCGVSFSEEGFTMFA